MSAAASGPGPFPELARLLAPFSVDTFLREYWEREPLHIERSGKGERPLLSLEEFDEVLTRPPQNIPFCSWVAAAGETMP
jgi:hypothetical protein